MITMFSTSPRVLKILAAVVWYTGGVVLVLKGASLLGEANAMRPGAYWPWLAVAIGVFAGGVKSRFIFVKSCRKNMARIDVLSEPKIWGFFTPGFFVALAIMIAGGATLSRLAHGTYGFLIGVAALDLSIATGLLTSSIVFWRQASWEEATGDADA